MSEGRPETRRAADRELEELAREIYASAAERFWRTPRRSLDGRTPREALGVGDTDKVRTLLINALEGNFA